MCIYTHAWNTTSPRLRRGEISILPARKERLPEIPPEGRQCIFHTTRNEDEKIAKKKDYQKWLSEKRVRFLRKARVLALYIYKNPPLRGEGGCGPAHPTHPNYVLRKNTRPASTSRRDPICENLLTSFSMHCIILMCIAFF